MITHLSLFSGIGGLDLAAEWAGIHTVGQCEWAEYPAKVLEKHWPDVPRWKDIRTLTGDDFYERTGRRTVDIISGGFPCQPFSVAGKQRGKEDDRYLWPEMVRVIKELRPAWVVGENVTGIIRMALTDILSELEACGYRTRVFHIPASGVGARHHRYRVAIVGYSEHNGLSSSEIAGRAQTTGGGQQEGKKKAGEFTGASKSGNGQDVANSHTERELQSPGSEQDIRNGVGIGRKTLADAESQFEGRLPVRKEPKKPRFSLGGKDMGDSYGAGLQKKRAKQQTTGVARTSKDIQHSYGTGCKEQYVTAEPDKEGFTGWGCDAGNVCNATSQRLSNRSSEPMGGQRTQEQESERSMRRTVESVLGGMVDGFPAGMDGDLDFLINHYWDDEPDIPRIATGIKHRVDRLKCLGNAVAPQQFYPIFRAIAEIEGERCRLEKYTPSPVQ